MFQAELEGMYRNTGAGKEPVAPTLLAMAVLLQSYHMVLDRLGSGEPAFSQGALFDFRERLIRAEMDLRLLERTVELARRMKSFDWKKLPKTLRVAIDSSPLEGASCVEDTISLLAHAARKVVACAADLLGWPAEKVARAAGIPLLLESSVKKALDLEWGDPEAKAKGVDVLAQQVESLEAWLRKELPGEMARPPLKEHVDTLRQIRSQDLEPDPSGGGSTRVRRGVAAERRVSIEDPDRRHGRKSKSKLFNEYKRHIASDLDIDLIIACAVAPANRPEAETAPALKADIARQKRRIGELACDRGYIGSPVVPR